MSGIRDEWTTEDGSVRLLLGDCLEILPGLERGSVDAIVTDPPYSSGGAFRGDRTQKTVAKYVQTGAVETCREDFSGDNRDQRAFLAWASLWSCACHHLVPDGGVIVSFIDWRQLPILTDAVQCGGWVWRGLGTWWKPGVRMQKGRFSASAEYVVYGSRGIPLGGEESLQNVFVCQPVPGEEKEHLAQKPVDVLRWAIGVTPPFCTILDPFCGSGTTAIACIHTARGFVGIEQDRGNFEIAKKRIRDELDKTRLIEKPKKLVQASFLEPAACGQS